VTLNTGRSAFFGEKFRIEKIFEDGGELASGMTTAAYDGERGRLVLSGECLSLCLRLGFSSRALRL
jgi:arylesterase/paraoxonase